MHHYGGVLFLSRSVQVRRFVLAMAAVLVMGSLAGCGLLSASGPSERAITDDANANSAAYAYQLIDLGPDNIEPYIRLPASAPLAKVAAPDVPDIHLVPGDIIKVLISDDSGADATLFAPLAEGGTVFDKVRIDAAGRISLPYVGNPIVKGMTLPQLEDSIRRSLKGRVTEPQVHIEMVGDLSGSVLVAGAVKSPGRFSSLEGPLTVLDAINRAGGPIMDPYLINVAVRTGSNVHIYNYQDLLAGGNFILPPNSEVVLERALKRFVAMGAVKDPGLHDLPSSTPSLLEVLGSVGGLNDQSANPSGVFVFRLADKSEITEGQPKAQVFRLDMRNPVSVFLAKNFLVRADDTIYVTNAPVYEMQKVITPIVQVLLLGQVANTVGR